MSGAGRGVAWRWGLVAVAAAAIALLELLPGAHGGGAILVTLALWAAAMQGCVAAGAAAELTNARWVSAVKPELLAAARLLALLPLLFLLLWPQLGLYGWSAAPDAWLNGPFFLARNLVLLVAVAAVGSAWAARSMRGAPSARPLAVVYLLLYAACQTLVAFDWVMSLSWPWVSSMLGMYFSVEGLYAGVALSAILFLMIGRRDGGAGGDPGRGALGRDLAQLLFGFSVLWGGLFFAQFLLLWYGNLPEEVGLIARRMAASPTRELGVAFLLGGFATPFLTLIPAGSKRRPVVVALVALAVLGGITAERLFLVLPVLPLRWGALLAENLILVALWWAMVVRERALPRPEAN